MPGLFYHSCRFFRCWCADRPAVWGWGGCKGRKSRGYNTSTSRSLRQDVMQPHLRATVGRCQQVETAWSSTDHVHSLPAWHHHCCSKEYESLLSTQPDHCWLVCKLWLGFHRVCCIRASYLNVSYTQGAVKPSLATLCLHGMSLKEVIRPSAWRSLTYNYCAGFRWLMLWRSVFTVLQEEIDCGCTARFFMKSSYMCLDFICS